MKTAEEMKEFRGTNGEWAINHWEQGGSGVTYKGESNGITHYTGDNIRREVYNIVSNLHPNSHNVEHSFEGAHIAEISARSEESLANARLIAVAPEMGRRLQESTQIIEFLLEYFRDEMDVITEFGTIKQIDKNKEAINKALGL